MRFTLIDRIVSIEPGVRITAIKNLSLAEEYLADHFPLFPIMPGVLMLEAMTQCGAWLIRATEDFAHSTIVLRQAQNVKYADFVAPGRTLTVTAEVISHDEKQTKFKTQGTVDGKINVSARLTLERYNLAEQGPQSAMTDERIVAEMRRLFSVLYPPNRSVEPNRSDPSVGVC